MPDFKKTKQLLNQEFESSSTRTPQYLTFHRVFRKEFTAYVKPYVKKLDIHKPNHFDVTGFFERNDGEIFYFSLGDLRGNAFKNQMLIRTAKDFEDYTGGCNCFINMANLEEELMRYLVPSLYSPKGFDKAQMLTQKT